MAGGSTVGALKVILGLDSGAFTDGLTAAQKHMRGVGAQLQRTGAQLAGIGAAMSAAITAPILAAGAVAVREAVEMRDALGQVTATMETMGAVAGRSLGQLKTQADALASSSLFEDDEVLRDLTTTLMRFGTISGQTFDRAQQAIVDYAAATKKDLGESASSIGRALAVPEDAAGRLARAGVILTDSQKAQIEQMVKLGNVAGAQGVILAALEGRYRGAAAAALENAPPLERIQKSFNDLAGTVGTTLLPFLDRVAAIVQKVTERFQELSPQTQQFVIAGVAIAAALGPVLVVVGAVVGAIGLLVASPLLPWIVGAGAAAGGLALVFAKWGKEIIPALVAFGQQIAEVLGPKIQPLMKAAGDAAKALGSIFVAMFSDKGEGAGPASALKNFGMIVSRVFGAVVDLITGALGVLTNIFRAFAALLRGDWSTMWDALGSAVRSAATGIARAFVTLFPEVVQSVRRMFEGVKEWLGQRLIAVFTDVVRRVRMVGDAFFELYDRVVGHSYVPDLINETGSWFARLQRVMVDPTTIATKDAGDRFEEMRQRVRGIIEGLLTDKERLDLAFANDTAALNNPDATRGYDPSVLAAMRARLNANFATASAGIDAQNLTNPTRDMPSFDFLEPFNRTMKDMKDSIEDSRERFADAFADGLDAAMRGDWQGVLRSIVGDVFGNGLRDLGRSLFDSLGGGKGGKIDFGSILSSAFGGGKGIKLPGFATGGSFKVGGSGGIDSQLMAFRATPGEMVDVRTPGKDQGPAGAISVSVTPSDYFDVAVARVAGPMAMQAGVAAAAHSAKAIPAAMARNGRQRFRGGFG